MSKRIEVTENFGAGLRNGAEALNAEPEHRRYGVRWKLEGDFLHLISGSAVRSTISEGIIAAEIAKHLTGTAHIIRFVNDATGDENEYYIRPGEYEVDGKTYQI